MLQNFRHPLNLKPSNYRCCSITSLQGWIIVYHETKQMTCYLDDVSKSGSIVSIDRWFQKIYHDQLENTKHFLIETDASFSVTGYSKRKPSQLTLLLFSLLQYLPV